jgi:sulfur carrier protein
MRLTVNGEEQERDVRTIGELLDQLGLARAICAVEVNKKVVPKRERDAFELSEGDRVEVVTLVGGG